MKLFRIVVVVAAIVISLISSVEIKLSAAGNCEGERAYGPAILEFGDYSTGKPIVFKLNEGHTSLKYGGGCSAFSSQQELEDRWAFHVQEFLVDRLDGNFRVSLDFRNKSGACNIDGSRIGPVILEYRENGKAVTEKVDSLQRVFRLDGACFVQQNQEELDFAWPAYVQGFISQYPGAIVRVASLPRQLFPLVQIPFNGAVCRKSDWSVGPAILEGPIGGRPTAVKLNAESRFFLADGYCHTFQSQEKLEQFWPAHLEAFLAKYPDNGRPLER